MAETDERPISRAETAVLVWLAAHNVSEHTDMSADDALVGIDRALDQGRIKILVYDDVALMVFGTDEVLAAIGRDPLRRAATAPNN